MRATFTTALHYKAHLLVGLIMIATLCVVMGLSSQLIEETEMDVLSDDAYKKVFHGLLGMPCLEQRESVLPIAKKWLKEYEEGTLQMSEKQFLSLKKGIEPSITEKRVL